MCPCVRVSPPVTGPVREGDSAMLRGAGAQSAPGLWGVRGFPSRPLPPHRLWGGPSPCEEEEDGGGRRKEEGGGPLSPQGWLRWVLPNPGGGLHWGDPQGPLCTHRCAVLEHPL